MAEAKQAFKETSLTDKEREYFKFVKNRLLELKNARKQEYGVNIEQIWADADRDYVPHRLKSKGKRIVATDEEKGWRGALVNLGSSDWQSDISQSNPYIKIQTALSILVDQNPIGVFTATNKRYQATTELMRQLYQRSWEFARSKQQLKLFVYNLAKYGWAIARTYPLRVARKVRVISEYDAENPANTKYEEKEIVEYNDIYRETLDPWNTWIDDMAKANAQFSMRDWAWRKVYSFDAATEEFGKYENWKFVKPGGITTETLQGGGGGSARTNVARQYQEKDLVEIYFYENRLKDLFMVVANDVPVIIEPLPVSDSKGNKKLSCWDTYWTIRNASSRYGIGIYEAIRYDQAFLDRIRNMTIDQITMSIYKMFFFQGTQALTETGDIKIAPGIGKQVLDPKNIKWLEVPGPGADAFAGLEMFKKDLDEASGISATLEGEITGKTAFEIAQAKESALKRLKEPLNNVLDALEYEGYITVSLIDLLYSIPETYKIADAALISEYLKEIESDPELFARDEHGEFVAKVFREFPLNLDKDEEGNLIETHDTRFFRVKPHAVKWEGIINIKPQSILTPSKQVDKALELEMYNMLIPLLAPAPDPLTGQDTKPTVYGKVAKGIVKLYDKDPRDVLPDLWLAEQPTEEPLIVPAAQAIPQAAPTNINATEAPESKFISNPQMLSNRPTSLTQRIVGKMSAPFRRI